MLKCDVCGRTEERSMFKEGDDCFEYCTGIFKPVPTNVYKPLVIHLNEVCGIKWALIAMRRPKETTNDSDFHNRLVLGPKDASLARGLVKSGDDHAKCCRGIIVYMTIKAQMGWLVEFETYRHGVECLSTSSTMHGSLKGLSGTELANLKQAQLPELVYTRDLYVSYQALRRMYLARKKHRHPDWQIMCQWIETLPYFDVFIYPEGGSDDI